MKNIFALIPLLTLSQALTTITASFDSTPTSGSKVDTTGTHQPIFASFTLQSTDKFVLEVTQGRENFPVIPSLTAKLIGFSSSAALTDIPIDISRFTCIDGNSTETDIATTGTYRVQITSTANTAEYYFYRFLKKDSTGVFT